MRVALPLRALVQRFGLFFLIVTAFSLMLLGKADSLVFERFRASVVDVVAPILGVMSRPAEAVSDAVANVREVAWLREENARLREDNAQLRHWETLARNVSDQNASLRGLLNLAPDGMLSYVTARVVADSGGIFVRSMLVNAGARHGVAKGHAVLSGEGLAGRIGAVGDRSARVLLITDLNSKIPVVIESTRVRGLVAGDNSARPKLVFLPPNATAAVGDRIVTSGHGGGLPAGLPVGEVAAVGGDGIRVRPFADLDRLDYLRVVRFQDVVPPVEATRTVERAK
jgi:rod shape-determining protein MreC